MRMLRKKYSVWGFSAVCTSQASPGGLGPSLLQVRGTTLGLSCRDCHVTGVAEFGAFSVWRRPLKHDVLEFRPGCHVYQEFVSYIHLYLFSIPNHTVFIHLPLEGLLGSFQCLAVVNGVAINILCAGLCVDGSFRFSRADTRSGIAESE